MAENEGRDKGRVKSEMLESLCVRISKSVAKAVLEGTDSANSLALQARRCSQNWHYSTSQKMSSEKEALRPLQRAREARPPARPPARLSALLPP